MTIFSKIGLGILLLLVTTISLICLLFGYTDKSVDDLKTKYAPPPSAFVSIMDMEVHYRNEGHPNDSLPIVLIHGTGASLHTFNAWTEGLSKDRRVIRMDLPGFGLTGPFPDGDYSMDHYIEFINQFLIQQKVNRCVLGGNSLGGQIAWNFTLHHPEKVDKLILIDAAGYPLESKEVPIAFRLARIPILNKILTFITPRSTVRASIESVYADHSKVTEELVDRYLELTLREGNRKGLVDRMNTKLIDNKVDQIKHIKAPTLILWGEEDLLIPTKSAYKFQADLPNDTLVIMAECGACTNGRKSNREFSYCEGIFGIK